MKFWIEGLLMGAGVAMLVACGGGGDASSPGPGGFHVGSNVLFSGAGSSPEDLSAVTLANGDALMAYTANGTGGVRRAFARTLSLAGDQLGNAVQLSDGAQAAPHELRLKRSPDGSVYAVFTQNRTGGGSDIATRHYVGGQWAPLEIASQAAPGTAVSEPDLAFRATGAAGAFEPVVVWKEVALGVPQATQVIKSSVRDGASATQRWSTPLAVTALLGQQLVFRSPRVAVLADGTMLVAALPAGGATPDFGSLGVFRFDGVAWTGGNGTSALLSGGAGGAEAFDLAQGPDGTTAVVWAHQLPSGGGREGRRTLLASQFTTGQRWTQPIVVDADAATTPDNLEGSSSSDASLVLDAQGRAVVLWRQSRGPVGTATSADLFGARLNILTGQREGTLRVSPGPSFENAARLAMDAGGNAIGVWIQRDSSNTNSLFSTRYDSALNSFSPPALVENGSDAVVDERPGLAVGPDGRAYAMWFQLGFGMVTHN